MILQYIHHCINRAKRTLDRYDQNSPQKKALQVRLNTLEELQHSIEFQLKPSHSKQAIRIEWLASLRKRGKPTDFKWNTILWYSKLVEVIPFLEVLNKNNAVSGLIEVCKEELNLIDFSYLNYGDFHVKEKRLRSEIESAIDRTRQNDFHPEAKAKLLELKDACNLIFKGIES